MALNRLVAFIIHSESLPAARHRAGKNAYKLNNLAPIITYNESEIIELSWTDASIRGLTCEPMYAVTCKINEQSSRKQQFVMTLKNTSSRHCTVKYFTHCYQVVDEIVAFFSTCNDIDDEESHFNIMIM